VCLQIVFLHYTNPDQLLQMTRVRHAVKYTQFLAYVCLTSTGLCFRIRLRQVAQQLVQNRVIEQKFFKPALIIGIRSVELLAANIVISSEQLLREVKVSCGKVVLVAHA
jgi:hypothetical protein